MTRTRHLAAALILTTALAGCSDDPEPTAAPTSSAPATSAAPSPSGSPMPDGYAVRSCQKVADATDDTGNADFIQELSEAAYEAQESEYKPIAVAGAALDEHVKLAEAAQGAEDEARMEAGAVAAAFRFSTACVEAGMVF